MDFLDQPADLADFDLASSFDQLSLWSAYFGRLLLDHLPFVPGNSGLDVACGTGFPLLELAQRFGPSWRFVGVDLWHEGLIRAEFKRGEYHLSNVTLVEADGGDLPFPISSFDLIVSHLGINNFADPGRVLSECARVARRGAMLLLTTNVEGHMQEFYSHFRDVLNESGDLEALDRLGANEAHRGSLASWSERVELAGFKITKIVEDTLQSRYLDGDAFFRHMLTRVGFLPAWREVAGSAQEQVLFSMLLERLNLLAAEQGELAMTIPMLYMEARKR